MILPEKNKMVLAWVEGEQYPFVGYYDGEEWRMETKYLNYDCNNNDIIGVVYIWASIDEIDRMIVSKKCSKCGEWKNFNWGKGWHGASCPDCRRARQRVYQKTYREKNREKERARKKAWYEAKMKKLQSGQNKK